MSTLKRVVLRASVVAALVSGVPQGCGKRPTADFERLAIGGTADNGMAPAAVVRGFAKAPEGK